MKTCGETVFTLESSCIHVESRLCNPTVFLHHPNIIYFDLILICYKVVHVHVHVQCILDEDDSLKFEAVLVKHYKRTYKFKKYVKYFNF